MAHRTHLAIYRSRVHLFVTILLVALPFVFLIVFAELYHIAMRTLFTDIFVSTGRLAIAYAIAAVVGWLAAVSLYRGRWAAFALPAFDVLQSFPTFAALPLATLAWGPTNATVITFLVITIIWPIFFSIVSSLKLIRRDWEEVVTVAGLSGYAYLRYFLWPVSAPGLITGSIIGLGEGWEALVATEIIVGIRGGLGDFFQSFAANSTVTALGILGLLLLIFSINKLLWLPLLEWGHREMQE